MRVYAVKFMEYTNCTEDTVSNKKGIDSEYLKVGKEPYLIIESDIEKIKHYGGGIRSLQFVGNI